MRGGWMRFLAARPYPHRRRSRRDLRVPRLGGPDPAPALDLRPALVARRSTASREPTCGTSTLDIPERSRIEYKIERVAGAAREWLMDPLNPRIARDPFGANSVCHGEGYETPSGCSPTPRRGPARSSICACAAGPSAACGGSRCTCPARFRRRGATRCSWCTTGGTTCDYAELRTVLDNLIHRLEIPPTIVALTQPRERLREYAAEPRHARFLADELLPALEARFPLVPRAVRARPDRRELRCRGRAPRGVALARGCAVGSCSSRARSRSSDIGAHRRGPVFDPVVDFVNAFRDRPGSTGGAGVRQLRGLRVADLREPLARAAAPVDRDGRALRRGARRPQLGELARPAARGTIVAVPRAAVDGVRVG